ncbi:MAG: winged helix-turn-helix transcriptional regulator [Archaeoglobaceae archaeon]|nr:winged helix-turn-helix transcriptional regulator [Archaeoglobaceae archaeon]
MKVLLSRKDTVKLLILSELAINKECNQRDIAKKLKLTPQAISEHFKELISENYVKVIHKGYYELTDKGIDWLTKNLLDLHLYSEELVKKLYSRSIVAIAEGEIVENDKIRYWFQDGYIFAKRSKDANGVAMMAAKHGEDVLIKPTSGFEPPKKGEVVVVKIPDIAEGGSRKVNIESFREFVKSKPRSIVVAIGVEALVSCRKIGVEPIFFGSKNVCVEAAHHGSGVIVACTESLVDDLLRTLIEENIKFEIKEFAV